MRIVRAAAVASLAALAACALPETETPHALEWSPWSATVDGVRCRVKTPDEVKQGDVLPVSLDLEVIPDELPEGRHRFDPDLRLRRFALVLEAPDGITAEVRPYEPDSGGPSDPPSADDPPAPDLLDPGPHSLAVAFPLASQWDWIAPGVHTARIRLEFASSDETAWTGTIATAAFEVRVAPAAPCEEVCLLPSTLRVEDGRVTYHRDDAEEVLLSKRNGFFVGAQIDAEGRMTAALRGVPEPDDANPIDAALDPSQHLADAYTITIYETADAPTHLVIPNRETGSYRELWKRTLVLVR
jgi:hypothetical protein